MWYERSTWRNLIDMHIPDWNPEFLSQFSPDAYADAMAAAQVDTSIVYAGNCLGMCFWPTKVGHMHGGLRGRDIVSETVQALRARGIRVVIYYNIWNRWAHDVHPSWRMVTADGRSTVENADGSPSRFGQCCMNSEGYRAFVAAQVKDLSSRYDAEGLWIDMIGFFGTVCCCGSCRDRYLRETGRDLPKAIDWDDPEWVRFVRHREAWFHDFADMVKKAAHAENPNLTLAFQSTSWLLGWGGAATQAFLNQSDYLAGDFYGSPIQYSAICKCLNNLSRGRPIEFMTSRCYDLAYHTATKPDEELLSSALGAFAHHAAFVFIDAIDPVGTIDRSFYERMGRLHERLAPYERQVSPAARMVADVAFYANTASAYDPKQRGPLRGARTSYPVVGEMQNIARTMASHHIAYDFIGEPQLSALSRYPVVVLAGAHALSDREVEALRGYVRGGGHLLATGEAGLHDPDGNRLADFPLADVLGVHFQGVTEEDLSYMAPTEAGKAHFAVNDRAYPLALGTGQMLVAAEPDAAVLATVTLPWSKSTEIYRFGSAISNPPATPTDRPAVTVRDFGAGRAMYVASALERETLKPQRDAFASLVRRLIDAPAVAAEAPDWLELILFRDEPHSRYTLSALSVAEGATGLIVRGAEVKLRLSEAVTCVRDVGSGAAVPFARSAGGVVIHLPEFVDFAMLELNYGPRWEG